MAAANSRRGTGVPSPSVVLGTAATCLPVFYVEFCTRGPPAAHRPPDGGLMTVP
ncbi:hypothetical protein GCM10018775_41000 [Streptomyces umbrinus]|nr:hypothetical protein GCM10018775_41000 [Streptomyces umbrinus]